MWQLATIARSTPNKFKTGASIPVTVVGQKDADAWVFKVNKAEKIKTANGDLNTVKVSRVIKDGDNGQKLDIWFAPSWNGTRHAYALPNQKATSSNKP